MDESTNQTLNLVLLLPYTTKIVIVPADQNFMVKGSGNDGDEESDFAKKYLIYMIIAMIATAVGVFLTIPLLT